MADQRSSGAFSYDARFVAVALYAAWVEVIFSGDALVPSPWMSDNAASLIFPMATFGLVLSLVAMGLMPDRTARLCEEGYATYFASIVGAISSWMVCVPGDMLPWSHSLVSFIAGASSGVVAMHCAFMLSDLTSRKLLLVCAASQVLGILIFSFAVMSASLQGPIVAAVILAVLLPAAAILLNLSGAEKPAELDSGPTSWRPPREAWRLYVAVAILEVACCFVRGIFPAFLGSDEFALARWETAVVALCVMVAVVAVVARLDEGRPFGTICYFAFVGITVCMVFVPIMGYTSSYSGVLATVAFMASILVAWIILLRLPFRTGISVASTFGFGYASVAFGANIGFLLGERLSVAQFSDEVSSLVGVAMVIACVALSLVFLKRDDIERLMVPAPSSEGHEDLLCETPQVEVVIEQVEVSEPAITAISEPSHGPADTGIVEAPEALAQSNALEQPSLAELPQSKFRARCDEIARRFMLSSRETEVFHLLAKGGDARSVAESMCVSYNTARTHIRNVYAKLDVHSRHEFYSLLEDPVFRI